VAMDDIENRVSSRLMVSNEDKKYLIKTVIARSPMVLWLDDVAIS